MSENNQILEREAEQGAAPGVGEPAAPSPANSLMLKKRRKKRRKLIIGLSVTVVILAGIAVGLYYLFREPPSDLFPATQFLYRDSIRSFVTGSGLTAPKDSATITLSAGGTVLEVFVSEGDFVNEGDPLYIIDSTEAEAAVTEAQKSVDNYLKQLAALQKSYEDLTVTAPFKGILLDAIQIDPGSSVSPGTKIATLVDDSQFRLSLYFSYAYEHEIRVGQATTVSIPAAMNELPGTVSEINYVRRVTPEGASLFEVVITLDNPGTLTADMGASATMTASNGEPIYAYEGGALQYARSQDIITKAGGAALSVNLINYGQVSAGQTLLKMDADMNDDQVAALENQLKAAQENLESKQKNLANFRAVAPMSGTVLTCSLIAGQPVESGKIAVNIADTTTMVVTARIDERNVSHVKPGMSCEITQWGREGTNTFFGTVESVSLEGANENGISYFPAVITVFNPDGMLMSGMYVDYNLVASQSEDTLVAPLQSIKYTEAGTCLFVRADAPPENALDPEMLAGVDIPEGFYAIPVTVGVSDNNMAEIVEGAEDGMEVFTEYQSSSPEGMDGGYYGGGIMVG